MTGANKITVVEGFFGGHDIYFLPYTRTSLSLWHGSCRAIGYVESPNKQPLFVGFADERIFAACFRTVKNAWALAEDFASFIARHVFCLALTEEP
jgi:hypothetical protein